MDTWNGFPAEEFLFEGKKSIMVFPKGGKCGKWMLKTEYFGAFPDVELRLLAEGFCLGYVENETRLATKADCDRKARFVAYVSKTYGLEAKCVPVGMSCGGAHAVRFAGFYPELVSCMYIDAPVLNFTDWPGRYGDPEVEKAFDTEFAAAYPGVRRCDLLSFGEHPICSAPKLIAGKVRTLLVYGTEDATVDWRKNSAMLIEAMAGTGLLTVKAVNLRGHHPHGMTGDNKPIVDYILANA
ncbi:MAG: hypothetical protein IKL89_02270 [Clostridia bacterium]|nr:hypothetical protein [Clostridia bacterium]